MKRAGLFLVCFLLFALIVGGCGAYLYFTPRGVLRPDGPDAVMQELMDGMGFLEMIHMGYRGFHAEMNFDFPRPPFYNRCFASWGLSTGEDWKGHGTANEKK